MDAAIRWSGFSDASSKRFLIADVNKNRLKFCQVRPSEAAKQVQYEVISKRDQLPNFTAFDWSRIDEHIAAIGTAGGEAHVISLSPEASSRPLQSFPVKLQRKCNSIALGSTHLLAVGLERIRGDSSLAIFDLKHQSDNPTTPGKVIDPLRRLSGAEPITNVKFFIDQPMALLAGSSGIGRQSGNIRIFDLREQVAVSTALFPTQHVSYLSIDPQDENYFASASPSRLTTNTSADNIISVWDRRVGTRLSTAANINGTPSHPVLEIHNALDPRGEATLWSLRYSGYCRGRLAALSSTGQVRMFETTTISTPVLSKPARASFKSSDHPGWPVKYCKQSVNLEWPNHDQMRGKTDGTHAIAFDWVEPNVLNRGHSILTMRGDRSIEVKDFPEKASFMYFHPENSELIISKEKNYLQKIGGSQTGHDENSSKHELASDLNVKASTEALQPTTNGELGRGTSRSSITKESKSQFMLPIEMAMIAEDNVRRRCKAGYLLDSAQNSSIVRHDDALVELWEAVLRMASMSQEGKMIYKNQDFSYRGVEELWLLSTKHQRHYVEDFASSVLDRLKPLQTRNQSGGGASFMNAQGTEIPASTSFPALRNLLLYLIRWFPYPHGVSSAELDQSCLRMLDGGPSCFYAAILFAYAHSRPDVAVALLKKLSKAEKLSNPALAAIIASGPSTSAIQGRDQILDWMIDDAHSQDQYLICLLHHLVTGNWDEVISGSHGDLDVRFRLGLALRFVPDQELTHYVSQASAAVTNSGDLRGIVVTGLSSLQGFELFQNYIQDTGDTQTPVLALANVVPLQIRDSTLDASHDAKVKPDILQQKWEYWRDAYFWDLQRWRLFLERSRFTVRHTQLAARQAKWRRAGGLDSSPLFRDVQQGINPPSRARAELHIRCRNCNGFITRWKHEASKATTNGALASAQPAVHPTLDRSKPYVDEAIACPNCGTKVARCSVCQHWLGMDATGKTNIPEHVLRNNVTKASSEENESSSVAGMLCFCTRCGHAYHAAHAKEWFARWTACAIPDCDCTCAM